MELDSLGEVTLLTVVEHVSDLLEEIRLFNLEETMKDKNTRLDVL